MATRGRGDTATRGHGDAATRGHGDAGTRGRGDMPLAECYREIGGAELADLVRKSFDRVRWWQVRAGNPGGCSPLPLAVRDFRLTHTSGGRAMLGAVSSLADEVALGVFTHRTTYLPGLLGSLRKIGDPPCVGRLRGWADQHEHGEAVAGAAADKSAVLGLPG